MVKLIPEGTNLKIGPYYFVQAEQPTNLPKKPMVVIKNLFAIPGGGFVMRERLLAWADEMKLPVRARL